MELEQNTNRILKIWWAYFWRATLFGAILGGLAGFVMGFAAAMYYHGDKLMAQAFIDKYLTFAVYPITAILSVYVMKLILKKNFKEFRIALIANENSQNAN